MLAFNVLEYTDNLEKTGVKPETARVHAEALVSANKEQRAFIHKELATKSDLKELKSELKSDLKELESELKSDIKELESDIKLQFEKVNSKFEKVNSKFEKVHSKIEASKYVVIIAIVGLVPVMNILTKYLMKIFNL